MVVVWGVALISVIPATSPSFPRTGALHNLRHSGESPTSIPRLPPVIPAKAGMTGGGGVSLGGGADGGSVAFAFFVDGSDPDQVLGRSV